MWFPHWKVAGTNYWPCLRHYITQTPIYKLRPPTDWFRHTAIWCAECYNEVLERY